MYFIYKHKTKKQTNKQTVDIYSKDNSPKRKEEKILTFQLQLHP